MSHGIEVELNPGKSSDAYVAAVARDTATDIERVKVLYQEEVALLTAEAKVKQFISVLAVKRVRQLLRQVGTA